MHASLFLEQNPYESIYQSLSEVREIFHREGRLNDSNAKLDETVKLLAIHFSGFKGLIREDEYSKLLNAETFSVKALQEVFEKIAGMEPFASKEGGSIFGARPYLAFESGDEKVAYQLFHVSGCAVKAQNNLLRPLDFLNEAFGHYVRDNFRSHIEDAQYMTPPEVVDFMVKIASHHFLKNLSNSDKLEFIMMDPSCGVGSFLTAWRKEYDFHKKLMPDLPPLVAIGQDKVDRMVRLSAMNLILSSNTSDRVNLGNSLADSSPLDCFNGKVDLILTNPPFGAKFSLDELKEKSPLSTPFFSSTKLSTNNIFVDSELLFIDRYLSLLRKGGICLAVVPDGVVSAKGLSAYLRQYLARHAILHGVIELPPVTFAQAGTRTKTAVLVFEKATGHPRRTEVFFGEMHDLGFEVSKRKGVPIKRLKGYNQLPDILASYKEKKDRPMDGNGGQITAVWRKIEPLRHEAWTPRQFKVDNERVEQHAKDNGFIICKLGELVDKVKRRPERYVEGKMFISVLHVIGEGVLDIGGVNEYSPITPGIPVYPGEVIISKINPRIPRVLVVPDLGKPMLCSSEFEVFKPRDGVSPYALAYMLMSSVVQEQIQSLTAGTSASHSRVKPDKLYQIHIPWPLEGYKNEFEFKMNGYQTAMQNLIDALTSIHSMRQAERAFVPIL